MKNIPEHLLLSYINEAVEKNNNSNNLNGMQDACKYFLYNSSKAGIKYK